MMRRKFMKLLGLVPSFTVFQSHTVTAAPNSPMAGEKLIALYARVRWATPTMLQQDEAAYIKALDHELAAVRSACLRNRRRILANEFVANGKDYLEDLL